MVQEEGYSNLETATKLAETNKVECEAGLRPPLCFATAGLNATGCQFTNNKNQATLVNGSFVLSNPKRIAHDFNLF